MKVKKLSAWSNQSNGQKLTEQSSNSGGSIMCSAYLLLHKNPTKLNGIHNSNQLLCSFSPFWKFQGSVGGVFSGFQMQFLSDGAWGWRHLKGFLAHVSGFARAITLDFSRLCSPEHLCVAWTSSQHGSWLPKGSIARERAPIVAFSDLVWEAI